MSVVCPATPCSWGNATVFNADDSLIWTSDTGNSGNGPVTLGFGSNVQGAGALIQADGPAQFTAQIQPFDGTTSLGGPFSVMSDANGDATFIGAMDTSATINKVVFSITNCLGDCTDFAIDTVSLNVPAAAGTPTATATPTATVTPTPTATPTPTPVAAVLKVTPKNLNFKRVKVGSSKTLKLTLQNGAKNGPSITFGNPNIATVPPPNPQEFGFPQSGVTNCPAQLSPKQKCNLFLILVPQSPGNKSSSVTIFDNASNAPQTIPLSGTGK
jgi:hypothetical protein